MSLKHRPQAPEPLWRCWVATFEQLVPVIETPGESLEPKAADRQEAAVFATTVVSSSLHDTTLGGEMPPRRGGPNLESCRERPLVLRRYPC